ncbi:hypothetical protein DPMN_047504 [Dreissena polymorpha]|uniref:Recombinase domain-containing protein n=1 Tax=Dreissena polymorpha TaxID=45954 RepID=A0A9D4DBJ9_DREPO|nr:hypothetical protein DPMN_047504 [Dreissena polymorpha]
MKDNLVFYGLPEASPGTREDCKATVLNVLKNPRYSGKYHDRQRIPSNAAKPWMGDHVRLL